MQCGAIGQPRQIFGAELLVHRDAEEVQLGRRQRHTQCHRDERRNPNPGQRFRHPRPPPRPQQPDRRRRQHRGPDLSDRSQRPGHIGGIERRPVHHRKRHQPDGRNDRGHHGGQQRLAHPGADMPEQQRPPAALRCGVLGAFCRDCAQRSAPSTMRRLGVGSELATPPGRSHGQGAEYRIDRSGEPRRWYPPKWPSGMRFCRICCRLGTEPVGQPRNRGI